MIVAERKYSYYNEQLLEKDSQELNIMKNNTLNKKRKKKKLIKISAVSCILIITISLIFILLRYTAIVEVKCRINNLNQQISELQTRKIELKAKLESLTRSDVIEKEAIEKLSMQYPKYEQMVFLSIEDDMNLDTSSNFYSFTSDEYSGGRSIYYYFKLPFKKLYSLLD